MRRATASSAVPSWDAARVAMRILLGAILLVTGVVWFFQGLGAIDGYGMSGQAEWSVIGGVLIVVAIGLLVGARKLRDRD
jgi:hypothetical protein